MFNRLGRIGVGCGIAASVISTLVVLVVLIVVGIVTGLPAWAIALITSGVLLFSAGFYAIFYFAFRSVLGPEVKRRKLLETGEPAEATILKVMETGITVNEIYPVVKVLLEVRPQGRPPYQVETRLMLNRMDIPQIQPGQVVPVKIDPRSPKQVAVVMAEEVAAAPGTPSMDARAAEQMLRGADEANAAIRESGMAAQARILQAIPLGIEVNGPNPAMKFVLEVYPADRPAFKAETIGVVAQASILKYQPDKMVFVKYDPNDTSKVSLDHS